MQYLMFVVPAAILLLLCGVAIFFAFKFPVAKSQKLHYLGFRKGADYDVILEFENERGERVEFCGNCTVWHSLPSFKRCGTGTESFLCDIWTKHVKCGVAPDA